MDSACALVWFVFFLVLFHFTRILQGFFHTILSQRRRRSGEELE